MEGCVWNASQEQSRPSGDRDYFLAERGAY